MLGTCQWCAALTFMQTIARKDEICMYLAISTVCIYNASAYIVYGRCKHLMSNL